MTPTKQSLAHTHQQLPLCRGHVISVALPRDTLPEPKMNWWVRFWLGAQAFQAFVSQQQKFSHWHATVMDTGIITHLSPLTSVYTLSNLPLCSFPLIILLYPTLIHYSYLLYLLLCLILPRVTQYYLYYIYFLNVSASPSFFGNSQTWCCQTSILGMPHDQLMFGLSQNVQECSRIIQNVLPYSPLFSLIPRY